MSLRRREFIAGLGGAPVCVVVVRLARPDGNVTGLATSSRSGPPLMTLAAHLSVCVSPMSPVI
jgi:hypothetical protein